MSKKIEGKQKFGLQAPPDDAQAWLLGAGNIPSEILQPSADWSTVSVDFEAQNKRGIETYDCTGFAILTGIEKLMLVKYGLKVNYSDRFLGVIAETGKKVGNDPHTVCEAICKYGLIPEEMFPFSDDLKSYEEYYSFKGADEEACYVAGKKWLEQYDFFHEWVFRFTAPDDEKKNNLKVVGKYCPTPISVYAWAKDKRNIYVGLGAQNHLTLAVSFQDFIRVFDSYDPADKKVDQIPLYAKRIYVAQKPTVEQKKSWFNGLVAFF